VRILLKEDIYYVIRESACLAHPLARVSTPSLRRNPQPLYRVYHVRRRSDLNTAVGRSRWQIDLIHQCAPDNEPVCQVTKQRRRFVGRSRPLGHQPAGGRCSHFIFLTGSFRKSILSLVQSVDVNLTQSVSLDPALSYRMFVLYV
jgi:hypothetical protein